MVKAWMWLFLGALLFSIAAQERRLMISPAVLNEIVQQYQNNPLEQAYCLYGTKTEQRVVVNAVVVPELEAQSQNDVLLTEPCQPAFVGYSGAIPYLGILHTHHKSADTARSVNPAIPYEMLQPDLTELSCSHYYIFPSGNVSRIPTADYVMFESDTLAEVSLIFCGTKLVMLDRSDVDDRKFYREKVYAIQR